MMYQMKQREAELRGRAEGRAEGLKTGEARGFAKGVAEGRAEGRAEELKDNVRKLLSAGVSEEVIANALKLSLLEVKALKTQSSQ